MLDVELNENAFYCSFLSKEATNHFFTLRFAHKGTTLRIRKVLNQLDFSPRSPAYPTLSIPMIFKFWFNVIAFSACRNQCFFFRRIQGFFTSPNGHFENSPKFSTFKRFYLRSETVSEEKSQGKNENFGALRAATRAGGEKKTGGKVFWFSYRRTESRIRVFFDGFAWKPRRAEHFQTVFVRAKRACCESRTLCSKSARKMDTWKTKK